MLTPLGALYVDLVEGTAETDRPALINRNPEPDETSVLETGPFKLTAVDVGAAGMKSGATTIRVQSTAGDVLVWDGTAFHADWLSSSFTAARSAGAGPDDEHRFSLVRDTDFESEDEITIIVHAETDDAQILDTSYTFTVRDYVEPQVSSVETKGLRMLKVTFDEAVELDTDTPGDALRVRTLPAVTFESPLDLIVNVDTFSSTDVGLFIGVAGAAIPLNNKAGGWQIMSVASAKRVTLDSSVEDEVLPSAATATLGPYRLEGIADPDLIVPVFTPVVTGARAGATADVVYLDLLEELSSEKAYELEPTQIDDLFGNRLNSTPYAFTSEPVKAPPGRRFDMTQMLPEANFSEDDSHDLERFIRCFQDVGLNLLSDVDRFNELLDVDLAPDTAMDVLLYHLGNPFSFVASFTTQQKRRLIDALVQIYSRNGTEAGVEAVVNFIVGVPVDVQPYLGLPGTWTLGTSALGVNTMLGPGTQFLRFSFQVVSPVDLTADQRRFLIEIVDYMKPAHTHFVRLVEPSTTTFPLPGQYWMLGSSALGLGTVLSFTP